jgi:hypothetical protein
MSYTLDTITPSSVRVHEDVAEFTLTREAAVKNLSHLLLSGANGSPDYFRERVDFYMDALKEMDVAGKKLIQGSPPGE